VTWILYFESIYEEPFRFFTGYGGGGFNSRAAFLLNGEHSSISFLPVSISDIHQALIMPLWSSYILSQSYSDGTMNQPFSSILAILSEYSVFGLIFSAIGFNRLRKYLLIEQGSSGKILINTIFIFFAILCLFDNMVEYPEIFIPFILLSVGITHKYDSKNKIT
jgi:hypothetical protein